MDALVAAFEDRVRPLVVMGDFNADWGGRDGVERVAARLGLKAFQPTHGERTFPSPLPLVRVDWILVSPELRILRHRTFREAATDHLGVVADLGLSPRIWARVQGQQTRVRLAEEARLGDAPVLAVAAAQEDPASTAAGGDAPAANQVESASPAAIAPRPLSARPSTKRRERGALLVQTSAPGGSEEEVGPRQQAQPQAPAATQQSRTEPEPDETPDPVASRPSVDLPVRASEWTARVARVDPRLAQPEAPEDGEPSTDGAAGRR